MKDRSSVIQVQRIQDAISNLLEAIGEDPRRQGLQQTPERVARMYQELFSGIGLDPRQAIDTVFEAESQDPVVLRDIPFHSVCEHHLLPFFGMAHFAYIPNGKMAGLSKLARALEVAAHRLQVQERLTSQVADAISQALNPSGVAVELEAEHLCMSMRGIQKPGNKVITTAVRGPFADGGLGREGLLALLKRR